MWALSEAKIAAALSFALRSPDQAAAMAGPGT